MEYKKQQQNSTRPAVPRSSGTGRRPSQCAAQRPTSAASRPVPRSARPRRPAPATFYRRALRRRRYAQRLVAGSVLGLMVLVACVALAKGGAQTAGSNDNSWLAGTYAYTLPTKPPFTVALDAGHGGMDRGATGLVEEVALTENTIYYLNGWLKNDSNYIPVLCRVDGEGASIAGRAEEAEKAGAQLLLSVHGNSAGNADVQGFECFPVPPGRRYYEPSLRFAELLAQGMNTAGHKLRGQQGVRYVYYEDGADGEKTIVEASDTTPRNAKSFGLLERAACPAVLVEQCFITNQADVDAWAAAEGCAKAARIYYEAVCAYFNTQPLPAL